LAPSTAGGEGCDNMTMILVQFKKPAQSSAPAEEQSSSNVEAEAQGEPKLEKSEV
jgi:protein phosphatase 1G